MVEVSPSVRDLYSDQFLRRVEELRSAEPLPGKNYYHVLFSADARGEMTFGIDTHWAGFSSRHPIREIRVPSLVNPVKCMSVHRSGNTPALLVNEPSGYVILMIFGGYGVVERGVLELFYSEDLADRETARDSSGLGFRSTRALPAEKLRHAPSKKLRLDIIKRDGARCAICGRSPFHHVDLELHVHHVIPWGSGGITERENLITLCQTCHAGLSPHEDPFVRQFVREDVSSSEDYRELLTRYQEAQRSFLEDPWQSEEGSSGD